MDKFKGKKAEMGVGTLILFIALLLTAAIAATVLIQTSGSLQQSALSTGEQARSEVATGINLYEVIGTDGSDGDIEIFKGLIKLAPGSSPVDIENLLLIFNTENATATLNYRGPNGTYDLGNDGYNTWTAQEFGEFGTYYERVAGLIDDTPAVNLNIDLDLDGATDSVVVCRAGRPFCDAAYYDDHLLFNLSTGGLIYVEVIDDTGASLDLSVGGSVFGNLLTPIGSYGFMTINGSNAGGWRIPSNSLNIYLPATVLNEDLDDDGLDDTIVVNDTHAILHYSSKGNVSLQLNRTAGVAYPLSVDLSGGPTAISANITLTDNESSTIFGYLYVNGSTSRASYIDDAVTFQLTPYQLNVGYFSAEYIQESNNYLPGVIHVGDSVRVYWEAPRSIQEDESVQVILVPRTGSRLQASFYMPNIIARESMYLYP